MSPGAPHTRARRIRWMVLATGILFLVGLGVAGTFCARRSGEPQNGVGVHPASGSMDSEPSGVVWKDPIDVASGDAHAGPWRMNESEFHYVDDPTVAIRQDGSIGVAWADNRRKDIFFQLYDSGGTPRLETPVDVSRSPKVFSWLPRLVMTSKDDVFVLWQEIVFSGGSHGGEAFFSRSYDGGKSFSAPMNLSNTTSGDGKGRLTAEHWDNGSLDLVASPDGALLAAWTEYEGALWVSRSSDRGQSFSQPVHVTGNRRQPARGPSLAVASGGTVYVAWTFGEDSAADIHFAVSSDHGRTFGRAQVVARTGGYSDTPKIAVDGHGISHLVYGESSTGFFGLQQVYYTRLRDKGGRFEEPRLLSASLARRKEGASFPSLAVDGPGNVYVVWEHHREAREEPRGLGFQMSRDGGQTFTSPSLVPGTADRALGVNGSRQGKLMRKLAVSSTGAVAVVSSHFREKHQSLVRLIRGNVATR